MWIGWIEFDVLLGDVHSLKEKRSVVRPVLAELKRRFDVSVTEAGLHDQYRRTVIGVGHGDVEAALELGQHRAHHGAFLLQAVDVAEEDVEFNPADPHAFIVSSAPQLPFWAAKWAVAEHSTQVRR